MQFERYVAHHKERNREKLPVASSTLRALGLIGRQCRSNCQVSELRSARIVVPNRKEKVA
jgi:hypothetical protein